MAIVPGMNAKNEERIATMVYIPFKLKDDFQSSLRLVWDERGKHPDMSRTTALLWEWFLTLNPAEAQAFIEKEFPMPWKPRTMTGSGSITPAEVQESPRHKRSKKGGG